MAGPGRADGVARRCVVELASLAAGTLAEVTAAAERGVQRIPMATGWPTRSCGPAPVPLVSKTISWGEAPRAAGPHRCG
jgi:hypothetical protein